MTKYWILGAACAVLSACQSAPEVTAPDSFSFVVIGDTPYDDIDRELLDRAILKIKDGTYPFIIHVGDYRPGSPPCTDAQDAAHRDLLNSFAPVPVFYTPGDNEWTDCDRVSDELPDGTPPTVSELGRLAIIREMFFAEGRPSAHGAVHQVEQPENARWSYGGVQFATLHVVATNNGRSQVLFPADMPLAAEATKSRDAANMKWLKESFSEAKTRDARAVVLAMQADMTDLYVSKKHPERSQVPDKPCGDNISESYLTCDAFTELRAAIRDAALDFGKPVILIHGDSSPFTFNQEFSGEDATNLWRLNVAGDAGQKGVHKWGTRDVTLVTMQPEREQPLSAQGLMTGKFPKKK